ncbi:ABC transporter ATP-binding protein [Ferviditalea candida]|uniref:ABC transporter ATP-binding protein n=1 Tax=Ferviditalea candida TaxID=3108399 RepID=A0ABU5ZN87_9BACL|nr:ABC transporter ATP-binding protein [Paenibacillaceae bacterium T2]
MFEVNQLDTYHGQIQALRSVRLRVEKGEIVAIIGSNGAGKSTLLGTVAGLYKPAQGEILLEGKSIRGLPAYQVVREGISLVPEGRQIFQNLSVKDNLVLGMYSNYYKNKQRLKSKLDLMLDMFPGLQKHLHNYGGNLSGGEQQMLAIARGLMSDPKLILFDEPSMGLAPLVVREILEALKQIKNELGTMVILVEQNVKAALQVADRAYVLDRGSIVLEGGARELLDHPMVQTAYLGQTEP